MRKVAIALVIGGAIVMVLLSQFGLREQNLARGELYEALVASPEDANALTAVFARFVPTEADLEEQAPVLEANGFRCDIVPASVAGSRYLTCVRPIEADFAADCSSIATSPARAISSKCWDRPIIPSGTGASWAVATTVVSGFTRPAKSPQRTDLT
jgi:hypothetical protein